MDKELAVKLHLYKKIEEGNDESIEELESYLYDIIKTFADNKELDFQIHEIFKQGV